MSNTENLVSACGLKPLVGVRHVNLVSLRAQRGARHYAENRSIAVTRIDALRLAKRVAAAMGLKAAKIAVIDKLFGYSPSIDWSNPNANPIVWPSNDALARQLGLSVSTTRHHLRGLAAAGLIAHSSHPTFQRRGVRDAHGHIVEAFGIDLSPIITRYDELLAIAAAYEHEGQERRSLSYRRTQIRREIEAVFEAARRDERAGNWQHLQARLDRLRETVPGNLEQFEQLVSGLANLRDEAEEAYSNIPQCSNLDTAVMKFRRVPTTADLSFENCSKTTTAAGTKDQTSSTPPCPDHGSSERKKSECRSFPTAHRTQGTNLASGITQVSLDLVKSACPALEKHIPDIFVSWKTLRRSGPQLCSTAEINNQVWQEAETYLGADVAIVALAVTLQRTDDGHVLSPGAYLRTLVKRGRKGQLRISQSLFALATSKTEKPPERGPVDSGFPKDQITWTDWADMARIHAPEPTPDIEIVADAFRAWCRKGNIDLEQPSIRVAFIGFCKKWRPR